MNGLVFPCILIGYLWCNMRFVTFLVTTAGTRYSMFCTIVNTRNISTASANNMSSKAFCLKTYLHVIIKTMGCSSNQIKSNHFYCHITTAQVPWWVKFLWACSKQCRKTTDNLHMDRQCKKTTDNLHMDRQCKKTTNNLHMDRQCKKLHWSIYSAPDSAKKTTTAIYIWTDSAKKQQQFTYGQYIFTDCTEDNVQNTHTYTQYT